MHPNASGPNLYVYCKAFTQTVQTQDYKLKTYFVRVCYDVLFISSGSEILASFPPIWPASPSCHPRTFGINWGWLHLNARIAVYT